MGKKGNKFKKLYLRGESTHSIANKLGISHNTVLLNLKYVGVKVRSRSAAAKLGVQKGRIFIRRHSIPKSSQKLTLGKAYILGVLAGDGWIWCKPNKHAYQICLEATDKDFAIKFLKCLQGVYKIKPTLHKRKRNVVNWRDLHVVKLCSKKAAEDLFRYDSSFKTHKWKVPYVIKNASAPIKTAYLKGFFDSEGSVDPSTKRVVGTSSNIQGLKEIQVLLSSLGIKSIIAKSSKSFNLKISDKKSIFIFKKSINFVIRRKAIRLKRMCARLCFSQGM